MWQVILAAMMFLQAPGKSPYSMVTTTEDGAASVLAEVNGTRAYKLLSDDDETPTECAQDGNIACYKPRKRNVVLNLRNVRTEWQRTETYDEGVARYATIARAIDSVLREKEWIFPTGQSWRYLVTIAYHESGFRRDIHTGYGAFSVGDCKWRKNGEGERVRIPGTCRSHGIFQSLFAKPRVTRLLGYSARQVVGDDFESTRNAVRVAAGHLDRLHRFCTSHGPRPYTACVFASYGGVSDTRDKRIQSRVGTFNKLKRAPTELDEYVSSLVQVPNG